jgi:hypothetical protein
MRAYSDVFLLPCRYPGQHVPELAKPIASIYESIINIDRIFEKFTITLCNYKSIVLWIITKV